MEERKQRWLKGSFTVEMAFLIPMILFLIMGCIRYLFIIMTRILLQEPHMKRRLREVQR